MPVDLILMQFAIGEEAGQLGAGAGAAGRAIVSMTRAEYKVSAIGAWIAGRAEQFNMVDFLPVRAANPGMLQRLTNSPREIDEPVRVSQFQHLPMIVDEEKPVAAPGHIAGNGTDAFNRNCYTVSVAIAWNIFDHDGVAALKFEGNDAHRGVKEVPSGTDAAKVSKGDGHADGAVAAHMEIANIVKEDHSTDATRIVGLADQSADHDVGAARLVDDGGPKLVEVKTEALPALRQRAAAQVRSARDNDASRLAAGVGINDLDSARDVRHWEVKKSKIKSRIRKRIRIKIRSKIRKRIKRKIKSKIRTGPAFRSYS